MTCYPFKAKAQQVADKLTRQTGVLHVLLRVPGYSAWQVVKACGPLPKQGKE